MTTWCELHEERHIVSASRLLDADNQAVNDSIDTLDCPIDLGCADPHSETIKRGIGAPKDLNVAVGIENHPIAVRPNSGKRGEIALTLSRIALVPPQKYGHRRQRLANDQLAHLSLHRPAIVIERQRVDAERRRLDRAGEGGQER